MKRFGVAIVIVLALVFAAAGTSGATTTRSAARTPVVQYCRDAGGVYRVIWDGLGRESVHPRAALVPVPKFWKTLVTAWTRYTVRHFPQSTWERQYEHTFRADFSQAKTVGDLGATYPGAYYYLKSQIIGACLLSGDLEGISGD
jgi:hypothetical protein